MYIVINLQRMSIQSINLQEVDSVYVGRSELRSENGQRVENRDISAFHTYFTHINFWDPLAFSFVYLFYYFVFNIDCEQVGAKGRIWKLTASTLSLRLFKRHSLDYATPVSAHSACTHTSQDTTNTRRCTTKWSRVVP